jgi:hypothetical protein
VLNTCDFTFYADYYAYVARAGIDAAQSLFLAIAPIQQIDIYTFDVFDDALTARDDLDFNIRTSYETVFTNMYSTNPMEVPFVSLSQHIKNIEGYNSVNAFVTAFGIKVLPAYASLSSIFGQPIESANIRDYGDAVTCTA